MRPQVSVVIPAYNEAGLIGPTVEAVWASTDLPIEVIVVDDGSVDGGCGDVTDDGRTKLVRQPHLGAAMARNHGAITATADVLMFIDAHTKPEPGWLEAMVPLLVYGDILTSAIGNWDGSAYGYGATMTSPKFEYKWLPKPEGETGQSAYPVPVAGSGSMLVCKDWYDHVGGFDNMRGLGAEDSELCVRCWSAGGSVRVVPEARLTHFFKDPDRPGRESDGACYLYNLMRAAILHHTEPDRMALFQSLIRFTDQYNEATAMLRESDIWQCYDKFLKIKRRDLGWLCRKFNLKLDKGDG